MEPRQSLSKRELLALLNWELAAYEQCEGAHFSAIRTMASRDDAGIEPVAARIVRHVVEETRHKFDVRTH